MLEGDCSRRGKETHGTTRAYGYAWLCAPVSDAGLGRVSHSVWLRPVAAGGVPVSGASCGWERRLAAACLIPVGRSSAQAAEGGRRRWWASLASTPQTHVAGRSPVVVRLVKYCQKPLLQLRLNAQFFQSQSLQAFLQLLLAESSDLPL